MGVCAYLDGQSSGRLPAYLEVGDGGGPRAHGHGTGKDNGELHCQGGDNKGSKL